MFNSMSARGSWTPKQDRGTLLDEVESSPCLTCKHKNRDKNVCKLLPTCPIRIPTIRAPTVTSERRKTKKQKKICQFPGCKNPCATKYCTGKKGHAQVVNARMKRHPDNPELWTRPVSGPGKRLKTV